MRIPFNGQLAITLAVLIPLLLSACAGLPRPELSADIRQQYKITAVEVTVTENARIYWDEAVREYVASTGFSSGPVKTSGDGERGSSAEAVAASSAYEKLASSPEAGTYVRKKLGGIVQQAFDKKVIGLLHGTRPATIRVDLHEVYLATAAQRVLLGGNHHLQADVEMIDPADGRVLVPRRLERSVIAGGGGISGVLADQITNQIFNDPVYRLSEGVADQVRSWYEPPAN